MKNNFKIIIVFLMMLAVSGCSVRFSSSDGKKGTDPNTDGGVFISVNKGDEWKQAALIPTVKGQPGSIRSLSANVLAMDPNDSKAVYLGTISNGLYYTYDITEGWWHAETLPLSDVKAIAVDPKDKCTIYATGGNKVFRSEDCSRSWSQIYYDNDPKVAINAIAIDHHNTDNIYIGTERGDVLKSSDKGSSWQPVFRSKDDVVKITISPFDSRTIFVSTERRGTARSMDAGMTWTDLEENLEDFKNSKRFRDLVIASDEEGKMLMATTYGLLRTYNNGETWERVELLTPEKDSTINALAIGPDSREICYVTDTTFYRSVDNGDSWTTVNLPSSRSGRDLLVSPDNSDIVYLTVKGSK